MTQEAERNLPKLINSMGDYLKIYTSYIADYNQVPFTAVTAEATRH